MTISALSDYPMPAAGTFPESKVDWTFDPKRAVFLIHDMQTYFLRFYPANSALVTTLKRNLAAIKAYCRECDIPVVYTAQPNDQRPEDRALLNDMWGSGLNDFPELQAVVPELTPEEGDTVFVKWRYSAFQRSNLQEFMQQRGRDQLLIGGVYAHIGCMLTAADAFMRDIQPFMIGDALADFSAESHHMALAYTAGCTGQVVATDEILSAQVNRVSVLTYDTLKAQVLACLDEADAAEFDESEALIDYGLDSIQIMNMIGQWRESGVDVSFAELARRTTLDSWWALIESKMAACAV